VSADQIVSDLNVQLTMLPTTVDGITADMDGAVVPGISVKVVRRRRHGPGSDHER